MRKALDDFLFWLLPNTWVPLYNSVSFSHMPYKKCIENRAWQDQMLNNALKYGGFASICVVAAGLYRLAGSFGLYSIVEETLKKLNF